MYSLDHKLRPLPAKLCNLIVTKIVGPRNGVSVLSQLIIQKVVNRREEIYQDFYIDTLIVIWKIDT